MYIMAQQDHDSPHLIIALALAFQATSFKTQSTKRNHVSHGIARGDPKEAGPRLDHRPLLPRRQARRRGIRLVRRLRGAEDGQDSRKVQPGRLRNGTFPFRSLLSFPFLSFPVHN
jgi:hypothetical protein